MVAITIAMIGRPSSLRSTTRSSPKQNAIMPASVISTARTNGNLASSDTAAISAASMTNSPWAKLIASVAL